MTSERQTGREQNKLLARLSRWRAAFRQWRRGRPFWAGFVTILAAIEINWSGSLKLGGVSITAGVSGVASWLIPALLVTMAAAMWFQPQLRIVVGVATILFALASFQTSNLGGWFIGMLLGIVGGCLSIAWDVDKSDSAAVPEPTGPAKVDEPDAAAPPAEQTADTGESLTDDLIGEQRWRTGG